MESIMELRTIPGYKFILKFVLKNLIQQLVNQLSFETDEETLILSMSLSEGMISHLGTESGKMFLTDNKDIKSQFYDFCLKHKQMKKDASQEPKTDQQNLLTTNMEVPVEAQVISDTQNPKTPKSKNSGETKQPKPRKSRAKPPNFKIIGVTEGPEPITIVEPHFPSLNKTPTNIRHEPYPKQRPDRTAEQGTFNYSTATLVTSETHLQQNIAQEQAGMSKNAVALDVWRDFEMSSKGENTATNSGFQAQEVDGNVQKTSEIDSAVKCIINTIPTDLVSQGESSGKKRRKRKAFRLNLNVDNKLKLIARAHEIGTSSTAKEYGIPDSTLRGWIKHEEKLRASQVVPVGCWEQECMIEGVRDTALDAALFKWYMEAKQHEENITLPILQQEAERLSVEINPENKEFRATTRWVIGFKRRFGIPLKMRENKDPSDETVYQSL